MRGVLSHEGYVLQCVLSHKLGVLQCLISHEVCPLSREVSCPTDGVSCSVSCPTRCVSFWGGPAHGLILETSSNETEGFPRALPAGVLRSVSLPLPLAGESEVPG